MTATAQPARQARIGRSFIDRQAAAVAWRRDNAANPLREVMWRAYRTGALWTVRHPVLAAERRTVAAALASAERVEPWASPPE